MTDGKLVPFGGARRRPDPARVEEFAATARKLQQERESSADVVARLLRDTPRAHWPQLADRPELRTSGAVERLGREVEARLDREPREALIIAQLETAIADVLPAGEYPAIVLAQVRAHAWKDLGQALCYLARHDEALAALDRAEALLEPFGTLAHDRAIVRFVRATTLQEVNRFDESLAILGECRGVFRGHGDVRRCLLCGIAEGMLLHRLHRYTEARQAYVPLLDVARQLNDLNSLAGLHNVISHASVDLSDFETAEAHVSRAAELFEQLHRPLQVANAEVVRGLLFLRRGELPRAIQHFTTIRETFLDHGLVEEAGLCGLHIVEAHLSRAAHAQAEAFARQIIAEFTAARLNKRAISALGYLSEAIAARNASGATVQRVRQYIHSLRKSPEREFAML